MLPCSHRKVWSLCRWDAACCMLVLYVALSLPPQLAFADARDFGWLRVIGLIIDLFFVVDVYVNLRTGVTSPLPSLVKLHRESVTWDEIRGAWLHRADCTATGSVLCEPCY